MCKFNLVCLRSFFLVILSISSIFAQENTIKKETVWKAVKKDGALIFEGVRHAYSRPFKWKKDDWFTFGGIAQHLGLPYFICMMKKQMTIL